MENADFDIGTLTNSNEMVSVTIADLSGNRKNIMFPVNKPIRELLTQYQDPDDSINHTTVQFNYQGQVLNAKKTLSDYGIEGGQEIIIHAIMRLKGGY